MKHANTIKSLFAAVALLSAVGARAEHVSSDLAARAVNSLIALDGQMESPVAGRVSSVRLCTSTNGAAFYVAKLAGGGFVVTSTDTEIDPIIAISTESDLVEDLQNPFWALLVGDMATRRKDVAAVGKSAAKAAVGAASGRPAVSDAAARWARLTGSGASSSSSGVPLMSSGVGAGTGTSSISDVRVSPLLKTKWGQDYVAGKPCFNYYTPGHYVCGCTATAGAQIFRYHKFPKEAVTPHTFWLDVDHYHTALTQMGGRYDWDNMPYVPGGNMKTAQRKAIGKLTYDVSVAVSESYSQYSTWGYMSRFVDLCHEWGFAHATSFYSAGNYTTAHLKSVLIPNLEAKLPVGVRVYGKKKGGHFVVADGYGYLDKLFSVHLNFGWNGASDAWYVLPGKTASGYTGLDELAGNIYPEGPSRGGIVSGRVLSASTSKPVSGIVVTATNCYGKVLHATTNAKGIYAFVLPAREDDQFWPDEYVNEYDGGAGSGDGGPGGDWEDDWEYDWYDEIDYQLPYDDRNHLNIESLSGGSDYEYYEDEAWVVSLENASPESHALYIWDGKNYYGKDFSVRIYTVKFDPNGGSGGVVSRKCNVTGTLPTTTRTGYSFEGWFTARNGGDPVTESTLPTGNVTYYAHWKANTYTVAFDSRGGSGSMEPVSLTYDVARELPLNAFAKAGTSFRGWSLSPRRLVSFADGETVLNLASAQGAVVTLYAFWADDVVAADMGEYFKATLFELGYDVPTDGKTAYSVVAKGLPPGLALKCNAAVKDKKGRVTKPAKVEWWIEGVPTAAHDFFTNPPYLVITANGVTTTEPLPMEVVAQDVTDLGELALGASVNAKGWLAGVGAGWSVSGLPAGLKFATKKVTKKSGSKTVTVAEAYAVYGKTTKAGLFTITAKKKKGAYFETKKYRVLVTPAAVDTSLFGEDLADMETMAYVPFEWQLMNDVSSVNGKVANVTGLPTGLTLKQSAQTIDGIPTKPGTYVVTFTKNVKSGKTTVAKTAQILWKVIPNDVELGLGFNDMGGVVESGTVGLNYGDLMAFTATPGAKVTYSGLPAGMSLVDLGDGNYAFAGYTAKAGTYLVAVTATLNGKTVTQRVALKVDGLPTWAKGTYNGNVKCKMENEEWETKSLATIAVSSAGAISGKFTENGTNWVLSAASYTGTDAEGTEFACSNVVAKYTYKATETVKGKKKTVTKYLTRRFAFSVSPVPVVPDAPGVPVRGVAVATSATLPEATEIEACQNIWGRADYKALGKKLFYTSKKKPYKVFTAEVYTNDVGEVAFVQKGDEVAKTDLAYFLTLSLKITPAGAVTATLAYDTGKTQKDPKTKKTVPVYYKPTCSTVVIPTSLADSATFMGEVPIYFAPSLGNNFPGFAADVPL